MQIVEEAVSSTQAKTILKKIYEENKTSPFSDNDLTLELKKYGVPLSRRTVAKYREELDS